MKKITPFFSIFIVMLILIVVIPLLAKHPVIAEYERKVNSKVNKEKQNCKVYHRVVFYNGTTNDHILVIEGYLAVMIDADKNLVVTVKTDDGKDLKYD